MKDQQITKEEELIKKEELKAFALEDEELEGVAGGQALDKEAASTDITGILKKMDYMPGPADYN